MLSEIKVAHSPHIKGPFSTRKIMMDVLLGLVPALFAAGVFFHLRALVLTGTCVLFSVFTECFCNLIRGRSRPWHSLGDLSAVVTGIILALSLPPSLPAWAAGIGSVFAIAVGKMVFGGLGSNIFNPAMAGRAFLTASFGMLMTTWTAPATIDSQMPEISSESEISAVTQATPLAWSKQVIKGEASVDVVNGQLKSAFTGQTKGCLGETSGLAILAGGIYLLLRRTISIHIPLSVLGSAFLWGTVAYLINPEVYILPLLHLSAGGLMLGAFFIATCPVTSPLTVRGKWLFGAGVGSLTMLIRIAGGYPEGVMFAVLLMNACTPLIDRLCKKVPVGGKPHG